VAKTRKKCERGPLAIQKQDFFTETKKDDKFEELDKANMDEVYDQVNDVMTVIAHHHVPDDSIIEVWDFVRESMTKYRKP